MVSPAQITELLIDWSDGDERALEKLLPLVERELHRIASRYMRRLNDGNTLQTTALINETYLKLINQNQVRWQNRAHFYGIAAFLMRRILLNYARDQRRLKRGGEDYGDGGDELRRRRPTRVTLSDEMLVAPDKAEQILALEEALQRLAAINERKVKIVELKFYGGLSFEEIAEFLKLSRLTVIRDWNMARAWLAREVSRNGR